MPSSPQGTGPQRFGRCDARWSPGERVAGRPRGRKRLSGPGAKWPSVTHPVRKGDSLRRKWMVPGAASDAMTTTTIHPIPDTTPNGEDEAHKDAGRTQKV